MKNIPITFDWIMMIVHDLKTPLGVVTQLIDESKMNSSEKKKANIQLHSISNRISDILFFAKQSESSNILNLEWVDLRIIIEDVVKYLKDYPLVSSSIVLLENRLPSYECLVEVDIQIIHRVLENLITNAIRFADPEQGGKGKVNVSIERGSLGAIIKVIDNGPGIPFDFIEKIFNKFTSLKPVRNTSGLGLSFVKLAIESHGGTIDVCSTRDGTVFTISL